MNPIRGPVPPVICTLPADTREEGSLKWSNLDAFVLKSECVEAGVVLTFPLVMAAEVEDLADREMGCCGTWLTISTARTEETVRLEATTSSPDGLALLTSAIGLSTP